MSAARITPFAPEPEQSRGAAERYRDLYRAAGRTADFGEFIRLGGVVVGGILILAATVAYQLDWPLHAFPQRAFTLVCYALLTALVTHFWGWRFEARGRALLEAIHAVVLTSPYLSEAQREKVRTLQRRAAEREAA